MAYNKNELDTDLTAPRKLRRMLLRCWDADSGRGSLPPELWHVFVVAVTLELEQHEFVNEYQKAAVLRAMDNVWSNRQEPYEKARWRNLDDELARVFGAFSGWGSGE